MISGEDLHRLIDKYLITPSDFGKEISQEDYDAMVLEINLLNDYTAIELLKRCLTEILLLTDKDELTSLKTELNTYLNKIL